MGEDSRVKTHRLGSRCRYPSWVSAWVSVFWTVFFELGFQRVICIHPELGYPSRLNAPVLSNTSSLSFLICRVRGGHPSMRVLPLLPYTPIAHLNSSSDLTWPGTRLSFSDLDYSQISQITWFLNKEIAWAKKYEVVRIGDSSGWRVLNLTVLKNLG
jgi:hypothetical protein